MDLSFIQADAKHSQDMVSDSEGGGYFLMQCIHNWSVFLFHQKIKTHERECSIFISPITPPPWMTAQEGEWFVVICVVVSICMNWICDQSFLLFDWNLVAGEGESCVYWSFSFFVYLCWLILALIHQPEGGILWVAWKKEWVFFAGIV